ncbi:HNH endonuclease signature motif containing protein [Virgibacillus oceani]|uniref:Putative HNH nuclease YajD n=1 Tax=Virgibacillus oceani TaxID=1479511 RepID=A0A917H1M3_9BACI|nr:HNH endonuclease signature motif containing protein [Virgibacillus oceani]GGG64675.1 HNH endonuclease [Virgibacillus oceani]
MELQRIKELIREDNLVKFYQCPAWYGNNGIRQQALERDNYECQECKRQGKVSPAQNVHHLKEVKDFPELALVLDNTESVCINCHNKEHKRLEKYIRKKKPKFWNDERW